MPVHITARHMFKEKETNVSQRPKDNLLGSLSSSPQGGGNCRGYLVTRTLQMWLWRTKFVCKSIIACQMSVMSSLFVLFTFRFSISLFQETKQHIHDLASNKTELSELLFLFKIVLFMVSLWMYRCIFSFFSLWLQRIILICDLRSI